MAKPKKSNKPAVSETPESAETTTAVARVEASPAMLALFQANNERIEQLKLERRNLPQMIKPSEVPVGGAIMGEIIKIVDSPVTTVKGKLLWLKHESDQEFLFPCTGVIRSALAPGIERDSEKLQTVLEKEIGKIFIAKAQGTKPSKQGGRDMFMFDVYTTAKPK